MAYRWNQPFTGVCNHVRNATLQDQLGGVPASRPEPAILHLTQRRVSATDQGVYARLFRRVICATTPASQEYESIYKASASLASFPSTTSIRSVSRRKRGDEDDDDSDMRSVYNSAFPTSLFNFLQRREAGVRPRPAGDRYGRCNGLTPSSQIRLLYLFLSVTSIVPQYFITSSPACIDCIRDSYK